MLGEKGWNSNLGCSEWELSDSHQGSGEEKDKETPIWKIHIMRKMVKYLSIKQELQNL